MRLTAACILVCCTAVTAEVRTLTLRESLELAIKQNPDILMARLQEQKAAAAVKEARDPFMPKLFAGSGLAYTSGFPMSIEGSAPSVLQARAVQSLYNRPLSFQAAATRENARGAAIDVEARREEVVHRIVLMHLSARRAGRVLDLLRQQVGSFESIAAAVKSRAEEGRELPIEARAAELRTAQARQRLRTLEAERDQAESALAIALGFGPEDRARPAEEEQVAGVLPDSETAAIEGALANSKAVKRLESAMQAKQLQLRGARSARYPQVDLVAQYGLMAKFNNYEDFFNRFQRHNWQLGMSFQIPIFASAASASQATQSELEMARLRLEVNDVRNRIAVDTRKSWQSYRNAESGRELARMDLDVTRERLSVMLAQFEEGRATIRQVEEMRSLESERWLSFYDAQHAVEQAKAELLRQTGALMALTK